MLDNDYLTDRHRQRDSRAFTVIGRVIFRVHNHAFSQEGADEAESPETDDRVIPLTEQSNVH